MATSPDYALVAGAGSNGGKVGACASKKKCALMAVATIAVTRFTTLPPGRNSVCGPHYTPANLIGLTWLPGCRWGPHTDAEFDRCGGGCFDSEFIRHIENFYDTNGWQAVSFQSRNGSRGQDQVELKGWYIPPSGAATGNGTAPRVVVQHGWGENANKFEAQVTGFMLASAGFGVIIPSLRDHCLSAASSHKSLAWGWDYPLDVLGAWDYAVKDPENKLGGELPPDQVGMVGFSMGAFLSMGAFAYEDKVAAVWADSPPYSVKEMVAWTIEQEMGSHFLGAVPLAMEKMALLDQDVLHIDPEERLNSSTPRPVMIVYNQNDGIVPNAQPKQYVKLLNDLGFPVEEWSTKTKCDSDFRKIVILEQPVEYRERLCNFFTKAFNQSSDRCASLSPIGTATTNGTNTTVAMTNVTSGNATTNDTNTTVAMTNATSGNATTNGTTNVLPTTTTTTTTTVIARLAK